MHRRPLKRIASLSFLTAGCGALALASACSNTPSTGTPGGAGTNANPGGNAGLGGAANNAGNGVTGGAGVSGGAGPGGGTNGGAPVGGTGTGGGAACKVVTALNGSGLTVSATDISAFKYAPAASQDMTKMAYDPVGHVVVILGGTDGKMWSFNPAVVLPATAATSTVTTTAAYNSGYAAAQGYGTGVYNPYRGIAFGPDGSLYVMAARGGGNVGVNIQKGAPPATPGGARTWTTVVTTSAGFAQSGTDYDHSFSGIAVSPDGMSLLFSSGSRTEHGEVRGPGREEPLSSCILKVPVTGTTDLKNEVAPLAPFLYADGTRNSFDLAYNAEGDLIGTENGPDIDLPDEINFLEAGKHYGFPWRFSDVDNPTRDPAYSRTGDKRLQTGYGAVESYVADAGFPAAPGAFTDPIKNMGPDANFQRVDRDAASPTQAAAGLFGVTGHRSPLGLAFDVEGKLCGDYYKQGFFLSYGALVPASLNDPGEDLVQIKLTKAAGAYSMTAKKVATGIKKPMDSVMVGNRLFVIGFGNTAQIYVFELPTP